MKRYFAVVGSLLLAVILLGCSSPKPTLAVYEGTLPGADCAGLKETLTLHTDQTYKLQDTYIATRDGDKTFAENGEWVWGLGVDGKTKMIQLDPKTDKYTNYLVVDAKTIKYIGKNSKDINTGSPACLLKKIG